MLIVNDHRISSSIQALAAFSFALACAGTASAEDAPVADAAAETAPLTVTLVENGNETTLVTRAPDVAALLAQRGIRVAPGDYLSTGETQALNDGARVSYRRAVPVQIAVGKTVRHVRSSAATVDALLTEQNLAVAPGDSVAPDRSSALAPEEVIRVVHTNAWTARLAAHVPPKTEERFDVTLPRGTTRTLDAGAPGLRETTVRVEQRDDRATIRTVLASRLLRAPRPRILVRGTGVEDGLARVAAQGFTSALRFAGSALHMLATAYTAGCYRCSGITASGARAGFGIIAVDPSVIPLGTKLFIPGYGRAVAGDTGGAINGKRIDLGFNSYVEAMRWGSRAVDVYVVR